MSVRIMHGDCRDVLRTLPDESVHCCVTSPPYFGLRDYGTASWDGGDPACDHAGAISRTSAPGTEKQASNRGANAVMAGDCRCGARRIDRQIGLEQTPDAYVAELVAVFREVRRVLRRDGTLWLNLGDSYAGNGTTRNGLGNSVIGSGPNGACKQRDIAGAVRSFVPAGLKPKDLIGIPWMVAFALRADGWYLRSDIIWSKPNPMPESVTDRPTKAHEYLFLLSKGERYFYDAEAISEQCSWGNGQRVVNVDTPKNALLGLKPTREYGHQLDGGRNRRSVWTIATQAFSEAHFATFPPDLIEPCIKAGTSEKGCCARCGAPWKREVDVESRPNAADNCNSQYPGYRGISGGVGNDRRERIDRGFSPSCTCEAPAVPCTVLDPFGGAGTTGLVADRLQRSAVLIELNPDYAAMAKRRLDADAGMFTATELEVA